MYSSKKLVEIQLLWVKLSLRDSLNMASFGSITTSGTDSLAFANKTKES